MAFDRGLIRPRRRSAAVVVAALALVAAGCWPQPGAGPDNTRNNSLETGLNSGNVAGLQESWSAPTAVFAHEPVIDGGRVVVSEDSNPNPSALHVEAFAPDTGARLWDRVLTPGGDRAIVNPVAFSGDALVVGYGISSSTTAGTCAAGLERLDPATGARLAFEPGRMPVGPALTSGDHVAVVTEAIGSDCVRHFTNRFEVRDRATLALQFTYTPPDGVLNLLPTFAGDKVLIPDGNQLLAFPAAGCGAATCAPLWTVTLPTSPPIQTTSFDSVAFSGGLVFARVAVTTGGRPPTTNIEVRVYDPATGAPLGIGDLASGAGELAVRGSTIYYAVQPSVATDVIDVHALDYCRDCTTQFTPLWSASIQANFFTTPVTVGGDVVYVGANNPDDPNNGIVAALAADGCGAAMCSPLATVPLTGGALDLSVAGGRVFAATTINRGDSHGISALALP